MTPRRHGVIARAAVGAALMICAAAVGQYALDASLDANTMVGGTGYNPGGRGSKASLTTSSYRLQRRSGDIVDTYGANSAFNRPEYNAGMSGNAAARGGYARAGLTRDQAYPAPATTNLRADDVQRRLEGGAYSPNDRRGSTGGLQSPVYQPYASTSYANPGAVNAGYSGGGHSGGGYSGGSNVPGLNRVSNKVPNNYGSGLGAPTYKPNRKR